MKTEWEDENDLTVHQWPIPQCRCGGRHPAALGVARLDRHDRHQIRLRHRAMRRLHGACGRGPDALLLGPGLYGRRQADHHHRGPRGERQAHRRAAGLARSRRAAMRLLPKRHDHGGDGAAQAEAEADRRRHRRSDHQHLPLRHLSTSPRGDSRRGERVNREAAMTYMPRLDRRAFVVGAAVAGGGLALGFELPFGPKVARAADGPPEVNAWVVIRPDDTVVIRVARSEMGQGTLTGLAQLVAEELECDWSKVTTEFPTPGQNLARKRVWGNMTSTGSQGIRQSNEYVRQGGAAARLMLIQDAANEWKVPASECTASNSTITHAASARSTTFGKVAEAAAKLDPPKDIKLKDVKDWKIAGKPVKRLDTYDKLTGKLTYGIDTKMPGMLIANIKACPVNGGKLKSFDAAKVTG